MTTTLTMAECRAACAAYTATWNECARADAALVDALDAAVAMGVEDAYASLDAEGVSDEIARCRGEFYRAKSAALAASANLVPYVYSTNVEIRRVARQTCGMVCGTPV